MMIAKLAAMLQGLFQESAQQVADDCGVIQRQRKFTAVTLAETFVMGFLANPHASHEELAQTAALCGVEVTPQAIDQRFTPRLAAFLEGLFRRALKQSLQATASLAPLLERFAEVTVLDSTTISLPAEQSERFRGCGGSHGAGRAAMKLQVMWDLRRGAFTAMGIEAGRDCDYKTPLQSLAPLPGSLRISDLGYFAIEVFEQIGRQGAFWLSRLQFGTSLFLPNGAPLRWLEWLSRQTESVIDQAILLGSERKMPCRLLAWQLPEEVANRRRQKLLAETRHKYGRTPTAERLAWCGWTILVTNVPAEKLVPQEMAVLYRARWQIELLFKRWKSLGLVAQLQGSSVPRQMVRLWARLLAVLVEQWFLVGSVWGDTRHSLWKAGQAIRRHVLLVVAALGNQGQLEAAIEFLCRVIRATTRQNKRKRPSTFELLNNPGRLEYSLT